LRGGLFSFEPWTTINQYDRLIGTGWMLLGVAILIRAPSSQQLQRTFKPSWVSLLLAIILAVVACIYLNSDGSKSFVYRRF